MSEPKFLKKPVVPIEINETSTVADILTAMGNTAFQARNLGTAVDIWGDMLKDDVTIFLGLAGAMVPAGLRKVVTYLIENRMIDCLVSTGANLFHDIHETLGRYHFQGTPHVNDNHLREEGIDRIYDVFASEKEFRQVDDFITLFADELDLERPYTTREFLYLLGKRIARHEVTEGIVSAAYKYGVPVYCPAIGDSSIGIALAARTTGKKLLFDIVGDIQETALITLNSRKTGVIYIGGGTPKNFIQQMEVTAAYWSPQVPGHEYAIQITADAPHWGGLSGCTFEEAQSWGKIGKKAKMVTIYCDSTIALPLIVTALVQKYKEVVDERTVPDVLSIIQKHRIEDLKRVLDFSPIIC